MFNFWRPRLACGFVCSAAVERLPRAPGVFRTEAWTNIWQLCSPLPSTEPQLQSHGQIPAVVFHTPRLIVRRCPTHCPPRRRRRRRSSSSLWSSSWSSSSCHYHTYHQQPSFLPSSFSLKFSRILTVITITIIIIIISSSTSSSSSP